MSACLAPELARRPPLLMLSITKHTNAETTIRRSRVRDLNEFDCSGFETADGKPAEAKSIRVFIVSSESVTTKAKPCGPLPNNIS